MSDPDPSLDQFVAQQVASSSVEAFVEASLARNGIRSESPPAPPAAPTERLENLWKELLNRAHTSVDDRLSIQADWNPAAHPRGPDGKFVERPYPVPSNISDLDTASIVRELADEDPDFDEKVEDLGIDGVIRPDESLDEALERLDEDADDGPDIPEERLGPPLSTSELDDIPDGGEILVDGQRGEYVTKNRDVITIKNDGGIQNIDRPVDSVQRVYADADSPQANRSAGVDLVPWGESIEPEDMSEGDWVGYRKFGQRKQMQVTSIEEDFNGNTLVKGEDQSGNEQTVRPGNIGGDFHESSPMREYPDVGLDWPDDREERIQDVRESLDAWVPLGEDAVHPSADQNSIGPQQADEIKDFFAEHLANAKDRETANRSIGSLIELGDDVSRAYDGGRGSVGDADRGVIAMQSISEDTAKHEMGHRIGKVWGMDGQDTQLAHNWRGDVPDNTDYGFTSRSDTDPVTRWAFNEPDGGSGTAWGRDQWEDKVNQEVGEGLDGRNFSGVPEGWDPEEGEMVRFEENPLAGFSDDEESNRNWQVVDYAPGEGSSRTEASKGAVTLENWQGEQFTADVRETATGTVQLRSQDPNETEGFLPDLAGQRSEAPDNWGMFDKDPDEYLGTGPVSEDPEERFDELATRVNEAWYRQAKLSAEAGQTEAEMATIINGYSATNAHETISQLNEVMQADRTSYEMDRAARALTQYHPELLEAYRHTFDITNQDMIEALNERLEQADAEFRFDR